MSFLASGVVVPTPRKSLLAGVVVCGVCGAKMAERREARRHARYVCPKARGGCGKMSVKAQAVDDYVVGLVRDGGGDQPGKTASDAQRLIAEVAEDERLLNDLAADMGERRAWAGRVDKCPQPVEGTAERQPGGAGRGRCGQRPAPDLVTLGADRWAALPFDQQRLSTIALFIDQVVVRPVGQSGPRFQPERLTVEWKA